MENLEQSLGAIINNEFDYSNVVPTIEYITYLAEYCNDVMEHFFKLVLEDEKKNEQYKEEYKNYNFKKCYGQYLEIYIVEKTYNNISCKNIEMFKSAINNGSVKNINKLEIKLEMNYKRGKGNDLITCENSFIIIFKPYEIKFARKSNFNDAMMNNIENNINEILKKFPAVNTIFCTK